MKENGSFIKCHPATTVVIMSSSGIVSDSHDMTQAAEAADSFAMLRME